MITSLPFGNLSVTPATRENPRLVTREVIEAFERANPALAGIGAIMQDMGLWVVDENSESENRGASRTKAHASVNTATTTRYQCVTTPVHSW